MKTTSSSVGKAEFKFRVVLACILIVVSLLGLSVASKAQAAGPGDSGEQLIKRITAHVLNEGLPNRLGSLDKVTPNADPKVMDQLRAFAKAVATFRVPLRGADQLTEAEIEQLSANALEEFVKRRDVLIRKNKGFREAFTRAVNANNKAGSRGFSRLSPMAKVAGVAVVAAVGVKVLSDPKNQRVVNGFLAKEIDERGGGRDGAVMFAVDVFVRGVGGVDLEKLRDGSYAGFLSDAADSWLPSMPATDSLKSALKTASDVENIERPVSRNAVDRQVDAAPDVMSESDVAPGSDAGPAAPASDVAPGVAPAAPEVPSAPGAAPSAAAGGQGQGEGSKNVGQGEGSGAPGGDVAPGGLGGGLGDVGGVGGGSRGVGGGSEGGSQGSSGGGDERRKFKEAYEGGGDQGSGGDVGDGNIKIGEGGSEGQESDSGGGDDDKGGLDNPFDDSVGGVGGDRANVLIDGRGVVGVVGDLVSLISVQNGLDLVDLVADWDASGGGEGPDVGPRGGFLQALEGLLVSALDGKDSGTVRSGVLGLADLVADWDGNGVDGGPGDGGGPGTPGGLVSNNEGDGTDGSKPTVGPKGGSKDSGQRVASNRTTTAGSRTVQSNRTVTTTTQQRSVAVKAPTAPQSQKLAAPQAPTVVTNTGPATQVQSPATKLTSPSNTTSQTQNPTSQAGHSE